jgi:hypothetical protein
MTKKEALLAAYNRLGPRSAVGSLLNDARELYRTHHIDLYCESIRRCAVTGCHPGTLRFYTESLNRFVADTNPISYGYAVAVRKELQRSNRTVYDCRTYAGQPGRDMRD